VIYLKSDRSAFEFVVLAALRTKQLMAGCVPRVPPSGKPASTAALEVLEGKVIRLVESPALAAVPGTHA